MRRDIGEIAGEPAPAHHFSSWAAQKHAERMGMWLFLATEILLFAGLFTGYTVYRYLYPETFHRASRFLDVYLGTANTIVLITSSFTVAMAVYFAKSGRNRLVALMLLLSFAMGAAFLSVKGFEYAHKFQEGALPGKFYSMKELTLPGAPMFFTVYFLTTGLHAFHVIVGMSILMWVAIRALRDEFTPKHYTAVELGGLYWHLVDLIWIFLYPLLYLV